MGLSLTDLITTLRTRIRLAFSGRFAFLLLVGAINLIVLALYLWSREGSTTRVRIEAIDTQYRAFVDGKLIASAEFDGPNEGGVGFRLFGDSAVETLPRPSGIDWVRVTDATTGGVLFEDTFNGAPADLWEVASGQWHTSEGVFSTPIRGSVTTGFQPWGDYVLEAGLRNPTNVTFFLRAEDRDNAVTFNMRPFRHYDSGFALVDGGGTVDTESGGKVQLDRGETVRSLVTMLLRPYPIAALLVLGAIALALVLRLPWLEERLQSAANDIVQLADFLALALTLGALVLLWYINYVVGEAMPHVPDSVAYIFQAKIFASFNITADPPPAQESFSFFKPHFMHVVDGRWFSQYPFGHPLFLSIGQLFGAVWLVPPLLGAASVYLIYRVGYHLYGAATGLLAAGLLFFSPFFQMTASNFMSHNTAAFVILTCLFLIVRPTKRRVLSMFLAGVFLGLLFNTRPLTAIAFIPALGALLGYELLRAGPQRRSVFVGDLAFAGGGLLLLLAYFFYNQATTGDLATSPQVLTFGNTSDWVGFGGRHTLAIGLQNLQYLLSIMLLVANGWPIAFGLALAALPFALGTRNRWDYFLAGSALAIAGAIVVYRNAAVMHGPRFWYETMPFLMLLSARGIVRLKDTGPAVANWLLRRFQPGALPAKAGATGFAVACLAAGLVAFSAWGWMLDGRETWPEVEGVPAHISALDGFNFTDGRLLDRADDMDLRNALIFVEKCQHWWCYGSVFWKNSPELDTNVIWAERQGTKDDLTLLERFAGRNLYVADYNGRTIREVTPDEIMSTVKIEEEGKDEEAATGVSADVRDRIRIRDLEALQQALEDHAEKTGSYPFTNQQVQTLCVFRELDAGCALSDALDPLPVDPLGEPGRNGYWYRSDGVSFVLMARLEALDESQDPCPEDIPDFLETEGLYCVSGQLEESAEDG